MDAIKALRKAAGLTQAAIAEAAGTSQPTVAAYEAGRKSPTLETVRRLAAAAGLEASVEYYPPLTREERRSLLLHGAIADRLRRDPELVLIQARRTLARMVERGEGRSQALREWEVLLDRPLEALIPVLTHADPWARELRHVTPFAGVLPAAERTDVYRRFAEAERGGS